MKKLFLLLLAALLLAAAQTGAKDLSSRQLRLRTDIYEFLRDEGYRPEIDSDGDIEFKSEGHWYWVIINENDEHPMFVTLMRYAPYIESFDPEQAFDATKELNLYKTAKVEINDDSAIIKSQMYLNSAEPFTDVFYKLKEIIDNVYDDFKMEYILAI